MNLVRMTEVAEYEPAGDSPRIWDVWVNPDHVITVSRGREPQESVIVFGPGVTRCFVLGRCEHVVERLMGEIGP